MKRIMRMFPAKLPMLLTMTVFGSIILFLPVILIVPDAFFGK